jgi:hypothetical protein
MKIRNYFQTILVLLTSVLIFAASSQACDYSSLVLNDIQDAGQGKYDISMTFTVGAGSSVSGYGADQNTWTFAFFCSGGAILTSFPATITSPNTGAVYTGFTANNDTVLAYHSPSEWWACIDATCGPVQPISYTIAFQTFGMPSEITLLGMEGAGNPAAGCSGANMTVSTACSPMTAEAGNEATVYVGYTPAECADLTASGSGGNGSYGYTWDTQESTATISACPTSDAHYFVTVTDNATGCYSIDYVKVNVVDVTCGNNNNRVLMCKNGQTRCVHQNNVGNKLNSGWVLGSCSAKSGVFDETLNVVADLELEAGPNPFMDQTTLRVTAPATEEMSLKIYNMNGSLVKVVQEGVFQAGENTFTLTREGLAPGAYFARLVTKSGEMATKKLMIQ